MGSIVPRTVGSSGYVDPIREFKAGPITTGQSYLLNAVTTKIERMTWRIDAFVIAADGDTWASGMPILSCFWCADVTAARARATSNAAGTVTFETGGSTNVAGYLLSIIDDPDHRFGRPFA